MREFCITAESVTEGHPDKVCDQISDGILDACLEQDPAARVAVETMASGNNLFIAGELTTAAHVDIAQTARQIVREIGYTNPDLGFDCDTCFILTDLRRQSPDINRGVSRGEELGAGDQGVLYGYATDETPNKMPAPVNLANRLSMRLAQVRKTGVLPWLRPDGKTQVTIRYGENGKPAALESVIVSAQHQPEIANEQIIRSILEEVILPETDGLLTRQTHVLINPTGRFVEGGPKADTGLTGRKLMVDTYGGCARHGGGAFSGKDPSKVDRSGAYMARYVAKNIVAAGLARRCEVGIAYAIGQVEPEAVTVETFGTETVDPHKLEEAVRRVYSFSVSGMIRELNLQRPQFRKTAAYGHFGRETEGFCWESTAPQRLLNAL